MVQVPKGVLPDQAEPCLTTAQKCYRASRILTIDHYDQPSVELITLRYFDCVYSFLTKQTVQAGESRCTVCHCHSLLRTLLCHDSCTQSKANGTQYPQKVRPWVSAYS